MSEVGSSPARTPSAFSNWILQYWYQFVNSVPMLSNIGLPIKPEDGPAFLFSTSFSSQTLEKDFFPRFSLVPWMTYRKDFISIEGYTSDCGWGCMLRSAQMMLAESLFRRECLQGSSVASRSLRENILKLFADSPDCPYSIHEMCLRARKYGKKAGEWFEPTSTLLIACELLKDRMALDHIRAIVARDGILDASSLLDDDFLGSQIEEEEEEVLLEGEKVDPLLNPRKQVKTSVLLLVPLRLGLREINDEIYGEVLIQAMRFPQSVGMIGGKPAHSLYFCGSQGRKLIFLDPHKVQSANDRSLRSYQCFEPRSMPVKDIDPSLALGFLVSSYMDFVDLQGRVESLPGPAMFSITTKPVEIIPMVSLKEDEQQQFVMEDELYEDDDGFEKVEGLTSSLNESGASAQCEENSSTRPGSQKKKKKEEFVFL